jgi:hypothetical protein
MHSEEAGIDATVSEQADGELTVASEALKDQSVRNEVVRQQFGPRARKNLCEIGFKTVTLGSGELLSDVGRYSLGCPETREEKEARLYEQNSKRQKFVDDLQQTFATDPKTARIQIARKNNEIVMTSASVTGLSPRLLQAMWGTSFSAEEKKNLCGIGFRGLRTKATTNSKGIFTPFACGRDQGR